MDIYTARQAVLNKKQDVIGYELLFRDGPENYFKEQDGHEATSKLIARTYLSDSIKSVTSNKVALINFTEQCLVSGLPFLLNPNEFILELVETVPPSDEIFNICVRLHKVGYSIALDDFIYHSDWERFFPYVKLIKFDIQQTPLASITQTINHIQETTHCLVLAEKVETHAEFEMAKQLGCNLFQGYYFCKPEMHRKRDIESNHIVLLMLQAEVSRTVFNADKIAKIFKQDSSASYKLLQFMNNGQFKLQREISSIKQAVVYLGITQVRKIIALLTTSILAEDKPIELTKLSLVRASCCENIATTSNPNMADAAFLLGIFSLLDAILDKPLGDVIKPLPLEPYIKEALIDHTCRSELALILRIVIALEHGNWELAELYGKKLNIDAVIINSAYKRAVEWTHKQQL